MAGTSLSFPAVPIGPKVQVEAGVAGAGRPGVTVRKPKFKAHLALDLHLQTQMT